LPDELAAALPGAVERRVAAANLVTSRVGGPLAVLVRARTVDELAELARIVRQARVPVAVIGKGSNLLVADRASTASSSC